MKAAFFYGKGNIKVEEVAIPEIQDWEILIKVKITALCGTDVRIYKNGHFKIKGGEKRVLGHEIAGVVYKVGRAVKGYLPGMKVLISPNIGCGKCEMCIKGNNNLCPDYEAFGISLDGGLQEYMKVPAQAIQAGNVIPFPDDMDFEEVVLAEPLSCCYNAYEALNTKPGETVLIVGAGPIGTLHYKMSRLAGAGKIIVADISDERLDAIAKISNDPIINSSKVDLKKAVMEITHNRGCDVVITACSVPQIQTAALEMAAVCGRIEFFGGLPAGKEFVELNTNLIHYKQLKVLGTTGSNLRHYHKSLNLIISKKIEVKSLITNRFGIDDIQNAFDWAIAGKGNKTVIVFD
ncbi:MAG: zinc-dependent dehydrogenase [Burkholderiales bacterium]